MSVQIPGIPQNATGAALNNHINDRLRRISQALALSGTPGAPGPAGAPGAAGPAGASATFGAQHPAAIAYPHAYTDRSVGEGFGDYPSVMDWIPSSIRPLIYAGTATADVSGYIMLALGDLAAGQTLFFPAGVYPLVGSGSAIITITKSVHIRGDVMGGTVFLVMSGVPNTRDVFYMNPATSSGINGWSYRNFSVASQLGGAVAVTAASNASPIELTAAGHGYSSGQIFIASGVSGNTAANGKHQASVVDSSHINAVNWTAQTGASNSTGNGGYTSGGQIQALPGRHVFSFNITYPIQNGVMDHVDCGSGQYGGTVGGYSLCTLPSAVPAANGNYFCNRHMHCSFNDGVNLDFAGDSVIFFAPRFSGDNVAIRANLVTGATNPVFIHVNSTSWRGVVDLVHGDDFALEHPDVESDNATGYPQNQMVLLGSQASQIGVIATTISSAITGSGTAQAVTPAAMTNIVAGIYVHLQDPVVMANVYDVYVQSVTGTTFTAVIPISFGASCAASNARVANANVGGGGNVTVSNSQIPYAIVADCSDRAFLGTVDMVLGITPVGPLAQATTRATGTVRTPGCRLQIPSYAGLAYLDNAAAAQQAPNIDQLEIFAALNSGVLRDSAGSTQAFRHSTPLQGQIGLFQNLLSYSRAYSNAAWTKTNCSVTSSSATAPDGSSTASVITESTDGSATTHSVSFGLTKAGSAQSYVFAVYAKADARSAVRLEMASSSGIAYADFDLSSANQPYAFIAELGFTDARAYKIQDPAWGSGWYLCVLIAVSDTQTSLSCLAYPSNGVGVPSYQGNGSAAIYLWDAGLQEGSSCGSIVQTNGYACGAAGAPLSGLLALAAWLMQGAILSAGGVGSATDWQTQVTLIGVGWPASNGHLIQSTNSSGGGGVQFLIDTSGGGSPSWLTALKLTNSGVSIPPLNAGGVVQAAASTGLLSVLSALTTALGGTGGSYSTQALLMAALLAAYGSIPTTAGGTGASYTNFATMAVAICSYMTYAQVIGALGFTPAVHGTNASFSLSANLTTGAVTGTITQV